MTTASILANVVPEPATMVLLACGAVGLLRKRRRRAEVELNGRGRVILRPSGTEPLVRVTLEGADSSQVEELARQLADTVREELGA